MKNSLPMEICKWCILILSVAALVCSNVLESGLICDSGPAITEEMTVSIHSYRDDSGEWVTSITSNQDLESSTNSRNLDVKRSIVICAAKRTLHIKAIAGGRSSDSNVAKHGRKLYFHPKCGNNTAIVNNGRTAKKINMEMGSDGVALTNRPLRNNELFEVRLDEKILKFSYSIGIGVTSFSPNTLEFPPHMFNMQSGTWMVYVTNIWHHGKIVSKTYGRNLSELKVGERVGVMRSDHGELYFFVNGIEQGPAATDVPQSVYGVFELFGNAAKGTIVD